MHTRQTLRVAQAEALKVKQHLVLDVGQIVSQMRVRVEPVADGLLAAVAEVVLLRPLPQVPDRREAVQHRA